MSAHLRSDTLELQAALANHGLDVTAPSQLSDAFRCGWNAREEQPDLYTTTDDRVARLVEALKDLLDAHESGWPDKQDWVAGDRARAALRDMGADT